MWIQIPGVPGKLHVYSADYTGAEGGYTLYVEEDLKGTNRRTLQVHDDKIAIPFENGLPVMVDVDKVTVL